MAFTPIPSETLKLTQTVQNKTEYLDNAGKIRFLLENLEFRDSKYLPNFDIIFNLNYFSLIKVDNYVKLHDSVKTLSIFGNF